MRLYKIATNNELEDPDSFASIHSQCPSARNQVEDNGFAGNTIPDVDFSEPPQDLELESIVETSLENNPAKEILRERLNAITEALISKCDDIEMLKACEDYVKSVKKF